MDGINVKSKDKINDNVFLNSFLGQDVQILLKMVANMGASGFGNAVVEGILMDTDDNFYYLSDDGTTVCRAIAKNEVLSIELNVLKSEYEQLLENFDVKDKTNAN